MNRQELEKALEQLHPDSFAWALRCCFGNETSAREVMQNTYLKILEGKAKYRERSTFKTWLFSVIRITAADYHQSRKHKKTDALEANDSHIRETKAEDPVYPETDKKQAILKVALSELSPQQNRLLHLVFYHGCSIQEAAEIMNIQLGTARSHYERGKQQLKKRLLRTGLFEDSH